MNAILSHAYRTIDLMDTVVHELGHHLITLPFGTPLNIVVNADGSGHADISTGVFGFLLRHPVRILTLMAGYITPILFGFFLMVLPFAPSVSLSPWWAVAAGLWLVVGVMVGFGSEVASGAVLLGSWVVSLLALFHAPNPFYSGTLKGVQVVSFVLVYVGVFLLLAARSAFTFLVAVVWWVGVAVVHLPGWLGAEPVSLVLMSAVGVALTGMGLFDTLRVLGRTLGGSGMATMSDFDILAEEFGGSPAVWAVVFIPVAVVSITVALLIFFTVVIV